MSSPALAGNNGYSPLPKENPMRNVVAGLFVSLDGVIEAPETWHFPYFDESMGAAIGEAIASTDAFLLGRRTYEEWAAYWPTQSSEDNPLAGAINGLPKYVVSRTLADVTWESSTLLKGDLAAEISRLKQQPGKDISVSGSATLVRSLLAEGLLDELRLMIHPIVVGAGRRLFENRTGQTPLEVVASETFPTGVVNVAYRPARG
jgi:dihydrofolate reductase